jgi:hypothetical protein
MARCSAPAGRPALSRAPRTLLYCRPSILTALLSPTALLSAAQFDLSPPPPNPCRRYPPSSGSHSIRFALPPLPIRSHRRCQVAAAVVGEATNQRVSFDTKAGAADKGQAGIVGRAMDNAAPPARPEDARTLPAVTFRQLARDFRVPPVVDYLCAYARGVGPPPSVEFPFQSPRHRPPLTVWQQRLCVPARCQQALRCAAARACAWVAAPQPFAGRGAVAR